MYEGYKVVYNWYHHMMPDKDRNKIYTYLDNNDYDNFIKMYKKYNSYGILNGIFLEELDTFCPIVYFPDHANVIDDAGNIIGIVDILNKTYFMTIDEWDCECG
jgi:hypothetical protein